MDLLVVLAIALGVSMLVGLGIAGVVSVLGDSDGDPELGADVAHDDMGASESPDGDGSDTDADADAAGTASAVDGDMLATAAPGDGAQALDDVSERHQAALAPAHITEDPENYEYLHLDQNFVRSYFIAEWPERPSVGVLEDLFTQSGLDIDVSIHVDPVPDSEALSDLDEQIRELRTEREHLRDNGYVERAESKNRKLQEYKTIRDSVRDQGRRMVDTSLYLSVEGDNPQHLNTASDRVEQLLRDNSFTPVLKKKDQERTHRSVTPARRDEIEQKRSMLDQHVGALFPFVGSTLLQEGGIPLGENAQNRTPIIYDRFSHGNGYNWLTIGNIGAGKSFSSKLHFARRRMRDDDTILILLDPLEGFAGVCEALDGRHIMVGGQQGLNPLEIEPVPEAVLEANQQLDPGGAKMKDLRSFFKSVYEMWGGEPLGERWSTLQPILQRTYERVGIDLNDPSTFHKDNPTIQNDLIPELLETVTSIEDQTILHKFAERDDDIDVDELIDNADLALEEERQRAVDLLLAMSPFLEGGEMDHLGGTSDFDLGDEEIVWLDLQLQEGRDTLGLMMKLLFSSVYERAKQTDKNVIFAIDEARYIMRDKTALNFLEQRTRHSRHYNLSIQFITQTVDEFFQHEEAKAIADNCAHRLIFRTKGLDDQLAEKIDMNPTQAAFARTAQEGNEEDGYSEAAFFVDGEGWMPIHITANDVEAAVVDFDPDEDTLALPGVTESQDPPQAVQQLVDQISEQYGQDVREKLRAEQGIPEVTVETADGEGTEAVVDYSQVFDIDASGLEDLATELGVDIEPLQSDAQRSDQSASELEEVVAEADDDEADSTETYRCSAPGCSYTSSSPRGVAIHRAKVHEADTNNVDADDTADSDDSSAVDHPQQTHDDD